MPCSLVQTCAHVVHFAARVSALAQRGEPFVMTAPVGNGLDVGGGPSALTSTEAGASGVAARRKDASTLADPLSTAAAALLGAGDDVAVTGPQLVRSDHGDPLRTPGETTIDSVFTVPGEPARRALLHIYHFSITFVALAVAGVGTVVAGTVLKGCIHVGSTMLLGPDRSGENPVH